MKNAGSLGSFGSALVGMGNLIVVFGVLGATVAGATDPQVIMEAIIARPWPFYVLELLKLAGAAAGGVTVYALWQRWPWQANGRWAMIAGCSAAGLLALAGVAGMVAISQIPTTASSSAVTASDGSAYLTINAIVHWIGLTAVLLNGGWYALISWMGQKQNDLPAKLTYVGCLLAIFSFFAFFLPPVGMLVLLFSIVWGLWLGFYLWQNPTAPT